MAHELLVLKEFYNTWLLICIEFALRQIIAQKQKQKLSVVLYTVQYSYILSGIKTENRKKNCFSRIRTHVSWC